MTMLSKGGQSRMNGGDPTAVKKGQNGQANLGRTGDGDKTGLTALPEEILERILEHVGRACRRDLLAVSQVSHYIHAAADAVLYREMRFGAPRDHHAFSESLRRRPRRASLIQTVKLTYALPPPVDVLSSPPVPVPSALAAMSNLKDLTIDVPDSLAHGIGRLFDGPFDMPSLTRCSLHYRRADGAFWDLRENIHVFASPTIETLMVRGARLDHRGFGDVMERPHKTPLRVLHFVECDLSDDGLADLLAIPAALEEFVLATDPGGNEQEHARELDETADNIGYFISALEAQRHSLRRVTIDMGPVLTGRRALRMREFACLETLRLGFDYHLFGRTSKKPRLHSVAFPPELRTLEFFGELGIDDEVTELLEYAIRNKNVLARKWEKLIVPEGDETALSLVRKACREVGLRLIVIGQGSLDGSDDEDGGVSL